MYGGGAGVVADVLGGALSAFVGGLAEGDGVVMVCCVGGV